jgi:alkanesulfonate monooxygenase SsuD/methylene tetrahydromethanopterin reductase-like flavin-dependent oxidoreductase (luciferase family)
VEALAWAAAVTSRIRLGAAVLLTPLRSPVHLAKSLGTVDQLSGGRLDVGIGLGGNPKVYPAYGITAARRVARFNEGLRLMRALWTEPRVTFAGEFWQLENAAMEPKPLQRPTRRSGSAPSPGRAPPAVGWAAGFGGRVTSTATFAKSNCSGASPRRAGPATLDVGKRVYVAVARTASARGAAACSSAPSTGPGCTRVSVWGSADNCAGITRWSTPARTIMLNPVFDEIERSTLVPRCPSLALAGGRVCAYETPGPPPGIGQLAIPPGRSCAARRRT